MRLIDEVEALGGMTKAVEAGMPKMRIEEASARRQARIDRGEEIVVGVNKFQLKEESPIDILDIDNDVVREAQLKRLHNIRSTRDEVSKPPDDRAATIPSAIQPVAVISTKAANTPM